MFKSHANIQASPVICAIVALLLANMLAGACRAQTLTENSLFDVSPQPAAGTFTSFLGIDGSKQPHDFGTNANLGLAASLNYSRPLVPGHGIGFQIGNRTAFTGNAVQVHELLGESKDRFQNFTTVGLFRRSEAGLTLGVAYDHLIQESYDTFTLGQWRLNVNLELNPQTEIGTTFNLASRSDDGRFVGTEVTLEPIDQFHVYVRRRWPTGVVMSARIGVADEHSEENAVTGTLPPKSNQVLFGAEFMAPLNPWLAIYGETNLMMPADTGAVDAYLGIQFSPGGVTWAHSQKNRFRPFLSVASSPTFTGDLTQRPRPIMVPTP